MPRKTQPPTDLERAFKAQVKNTLNALILGRNISRNQLAKRMGISMSRLTEMLDIPSLGNISRICETLNVEPQIRLKAASRNRPPPKLEEGALKGRPKNAPPEAEDECLD